MTRHLSAPTLSETPVVIDCLAASILVLRGWTVRQNCSRQRRSHFTVQNAREALAAQNTTLCTSDPAERTARRTNGIRLRRTGSAVTRYPPERYSIPTKLLRNTWSKHLFGVIKEMSANNEAIPDPLGERRYKGKFNVRTSPSLHRELVIRAATEGISLNALVNQCLAAN